MKLSLLPSLASLALLAMPAAGQGSALPYLPKQTMMAICVPDLSMSIAEFATMPLAKMWAEEEVQNFFADVKTMAKKEIDKGIAHLKEMHGKGALPFDPDQLMQLRVHGGTFAVTHLEVTMGDFGPMPKFGVVLHLDFGDSAPQWNSLLQTGLGLMEAQAGDEMVKKEAKIGEVEMLSYLPNDAKGIEMGLNIAMVPGGIVIGTLAGDVRGLVENMQAKTPVLAATEQYQATAKHLSTDGAEIEVYVHADPIVDFGVGALRLIASQSDELKMVDMDGVERAIAAMGWNHLGSQGVTSKYVDGKCVTRSYSVSEGAGTTAAVKTIDTAFLKWVPKDAVGFSASTLDFMHVYNTLLAGLQAYDPEFAKHALDHLAEIEKQLGFSVRDDLFGSLGDHYISWSMPMGTISSAPEIAMLLKVTDEAKLVKVLKSLAQLSNGAVEIDEGEKRGLKAYQVRINFDPTRGMGGMNPLDMFQPTFAFKNGYMVAGFSASDIKRVFQRMDREDDPKGDIRSNKEFAAVANTLPAGIDSVSFTDWKSQFESLYQISTGLLAFVPLGEDVPIDMSLLPDAGTLTKHLFGSLSYGKSDSKHTESVSISPFGPEMALFLAAAIGAGAGAYGWMSARHR
ncbi:MAG TPA: hypothetical protein VFZ65_22670 [Planctomycetota bacterium]|nr:hypothetical protein [Planctomycetota bacterium]